MKRYLIFSFFFLLGVVIMGEQHNTNYVPGEIIIKLKNLSNNYSFNQNSNGIIKTEFEKIDKLNSKFKVKKIEKVFKNVKEHTFKSYSKIKKRDFSITHFVRSF